MKKIWFSLVLLLAMPVSTGMAHTAQDAGPRPIKQTAVNVTFDGQPLDTAIKGERSIMVPLRSVAESVGSSVSWNPYHHTAVVSNGSMKIRFTAGSSTAYVNQTPTALPERAIIKHGRLFVPMVVLKRLIQNNEYSMVYSNQQDRVQILSKTSLADAMYNLSQIQATQGQAAPSSVGYGPQPEEEQQLPEKVYIPSLDSLISDSK